MVADIKLKLKKIDKRRIEEKLNLKLLINDEQLKETYRIEVENRYGILNNEEPLEEEEEMDADWQKLQKALNDPAKEMVPKTERRGRQRWMTEGILDKMEEKRKCKESNPPRYEELEQEIRQECDTAKENWIKEQCTEVEELERNHKFESMHKKIKEITGKRKLARGNVIKNKEGEIMMEIEEVLNRWEEYVKDLFEDDRGRKPRIHIPMTGPEILEEEILYVIKSFKRGKSPGNDEITIEMILASGNFRIKKIVELANEIYNTGYIHKDMYI